MKTKRTCGSGVANANAMPMRDTLMVRVMPDKAYLWGLNKRCVNESPLGYGTHALWLHQVARDTGEPCAMQYPKRGMTGAKHPAPQKCDHAWCGSPGQHSTESFKHVRLNIDQWENRLIWNALIPRIASTSRKPEQENKMEIPKLMPRFRADGMPAGSERQT